MTRPVLLVAPLALLVGGVPSPAAGPVTPEQIDAAIKRGTDYLKGIYKPAPDQALGQATALSGLALLESDVPATDPAVKQIAALIRDAAYGEVQTYQLASSLLFLDRLKDPADVPLIQLLAVRLIAGQTPGGGWDYGCVQQVPEDVQKRLRSNLRPGASDWKPGTLHPEVAAYARTLAPHAPGDDNSNTQFGVLAVWVARRHNVPVENALTRIEARFLSTQTPNGGWPYNAGSSGSPSMICAGLLGLATGVARRHERLVTAPAPGAAPPAPKPKGPKPDDPFFDPPAKAAKGPKKVAAPKPEPDRTDAAVARGFAALGSVLAAEARAAGAAGFRVGNQHNDHQNVYFLWSLERVGVIYGLEKIGGVDWYDVGAAGLIRTQLGNGSWEAGGFFPEANTALALLFLNKSNVVRDLTSTLQKKDRSKDPPPPVEAPAAAPPPVSDAKAAALARDLLDAPAGEWAKKLAALRDATGAEHTRALLLAIGRLTGEKRTQVRDALAERLAKMTADTLRGMLRSDDPELRRAAALACAMKADKGHVPDLIDRLTDDEEFVVRAARAGLKSLTGQDHGPPNGSTREQRKVAADKWRAAVKGK